MPSSAFGIFKIFTIKNNYFLHLFRLSAASKLKCFWSWTELFYKKKKSAPAFVWRHNNVSASCLTSKCHADKQSGRQCINPSVPRIKIIKEEKSANLTFSWHLMDWFAKKKIKSQGSLWCTLGSNFSFFQQLDLKKYKKQNIGTVMPIRH